MRKYYLFFFLQLVFSSSLFAQTPETEPNNDCSTANEIVYKGTYTGEFTAGNVGSLGDYDYWYIDISGMPSGNISITFNSDDPFAGGWQIQKFTASGCSTPVAYLPGGSPDPENFYHFFNETHSVGWTAAENLVGLTIKAGDDFVGGGTYSIIINSGLPDPPAPVAETEPNDDCASSIANNQIQYLGTYSGQVNWIVDENDYWYIDLTAIPSGTLSFAITTDNSDGVGYRFIKYDANGCATPAGYQPAITPGLDNFYLSQITPAESFTWTAADNLVGLGIQIQINFTLPVNYSFTISSGLPNPPGSLSPGGVAGANLWYKADEGVTQSSGSVSNWANQGSIANINAAQGTAANQPTLQTSGAAQINFNPAVRFDGSNDFLETPAFSTPFGTDGNGDFVASQFIVYRSLSASDGIAYSFDDASFIFLGAHTLGRFNQGGRRVDDNEPVAQNEVALMDMVATSGPSVFSPSLNKNGRENQTINSGSNNNGTNQTFLIGKWGAGAIAHADIAEIVVYPAILNGSDRNKVQTYLALKYGISLGNNTSAVDYISSAGSTIWSADATYKYDIFGIGKDDGSGLNQPQSNSANTGSGDGTGQSGKGNIVLSNPSSLEDGDFLILGHDNGALTEQTTDLPSSLTGSKRLARKWKVSHTNDVGTVNLTFSSLGLTLSGTTAADFKLLIDTDGNGDFTNGPVTEVNATAFAGNVVSFDAVTLPHDAVFTILTSPFVLAPGDVTGVKLWLDASDVDGDGNSGNDPADGTDVSTWVDKSGNGNHVTVSGITQSTVNAPSYFSNQFNGKSALRFDRSNREALGKVLSTNYTGPLTVFVVIQSQTPTPAQFDSFFSSWYQPFNTASFQIDYDGSSAFRVNATGGTTVLFGPANQELELYAVRYQSNQIQTFTDGNLVNQAAYSSDLGFSEYRVGVNRAGANFFDSKIAEVIVYHRALDACELEKVNLYLGNKYGRDFTNVAANFDFETTYPGDINGIGAFASACSGLNTVNSATSSIITIDNPSSNDTANEFLTFGHDNRSLAETLTNLPSNLAGSRRLGRSWKVDRDGDVGSVSLSFDLSGITVSGNQAADFKLLIDTDADGDFTTGSITQITPNEYLSDILTFTDISLPHNSVFTLLTDFSPVAPGGVAGANLWLKTDQGASPSSGTLTSWDDQTGVHAMTIAGDPQISQNGVNFNPTVTFDGTDDDIQTSYSVDLNTPSFTISAVVKVTNGVGFHSIVTNKDQGSNINRGYIIYVHDSNLEFWIGNTAGNWTTINGGSVPLNEYVLVTVTYGAGTMHIYKNGLQAATAASAYQQRQTTVQPFRVGMGSNSAGIPSFGFEGDIPEVVYYPSVLSATDKKQVESYLAVKYGITLNSSVASYNASDGTALWDNTSYWNDIFGIGKDDATGLNQTQSNCMNTGSGDGTGQNGKGNLVITAGTPLDDGAFFLVGHNNNDFSLTTIDRPSGSFLRVDRQWKVKVTAQPGNLDISFDFNGLPLPGNKVSDFKILLDADGDGDFSNASEIPASSLSGSVVNFDGISFDNRDGTVFTFIVGPSVGPGVLGANLWLKADEGASPGSGTLTSWTDQSGINSFTITGNPQTGTAAINFNNAVDFDGNGDFLTGDALIKFQTLYAVYKIENPGTDDLAGAISGGTLMTVGPLDGGRVGRDFAKSGKLSVFTGTGDVFLSSGYLGAEKPRLAIVEVVDGQPATGHNTYIDGQFFSTLTGIGSGNFSSFTSNPIIGRTTEINRDFLDGQVAEIIMYPASHSVDDRNKIQSYLAIKYGITLDPSVTNYVNSAGTSVWSDTNYWNDIFGIGRDDASTLNQTQSNSINTGSGDGIGQSAKGNIVISNPSSLDDGEFLLIGHDSGDLTTQTTDLPSNLGAFRLKREWKVQRTGDPGTVTLKVDLSGLNINGTQASDIKLLIDTDGNGDFTDGNPEIRVASTFTNSVAEFLGVNLPNNAVFTIVTGPGNPTWELRKETNVPNYNTAGRPIVYKFVLTNTGNVPITNIRLFDTTLNLEPGFDQNSDIGRDQILSPGEVWEYITPYRVTQADVDAGFFTNIAEATCNSAAGAPTPASDTLTVNAVQSPAWNLTKSTTATGYSQVGEVIPYEFQLSNTGNVSISNVSLSDNLLFTPPVLVSGDLGNKGVLEVGETWVYQGSYTVTQADLDSGSITNTASASGTPAGGNLAATTDSVTINANQSAQISLTKSADRTFFDAANQVITYTLQVQNTGNLTLTNVEVTDPLLGGTIGTIATLAPGATQTFTETYATTQVDLDAGEVRNSASVSASTPSSTQVSDQADVVVPARQAAALDLDKTASTTSFVNAGEVVTYTFTVTNTGNVTLKEVNLSDARISFNQSIGILAPGETQTFTSDYTITQADVNSQIVINTATVSGKSPSDVVVDATASAYVAGQDQGALEVIKKVKEKTYSQAGETLNYDILVRNVGNITVNTIQVTDNLTGFSTTIPSLAPGASTTLTTSYPVTQPDLDAGKVVNEVNVSGVEASPQATVLTAKDIEVSTAKVSPSINVQTSLQSGPNPYSALGEILTFETVVTNTGNVTLSNVTISEPLSGINIPSITSLAPGASQSFTFTYTIKQSDLDAGSVTNTASVSGTSPSSIQVSDQASVTVLSGQNNGIVLTKTGNPATYSQVGEEITYSLEVRNTGNVTLSNVTITDPLTGLNQNLGPIISGVSIPVTATYRITQQDLDRGFVSNTARVSATDPSNQSISTTAIDTVRAVQNPQLILQKTADKSSYSTLGEPITYTLTISNPGNVTLKNLLVSDPLTGVNSNLGTLSPGDTKTVKTTYLVTQQDLDAGDLTNTAIVDAVDPNAVTIEVTDALTINAVQNPGIEIVKTALSSTFAGVNDLLEYEIKVTNTGNVTLSSVTVEDPLTQTNQNVGTLIPGASQTITVSYFVTQADLDNGSVINTATVSATDPSSNTVHDQSSVTVQGTSSPSLSFTKTADKVNVQSVGEIITYTLEVTNTGNVTLSDLVVEDNLTGFVSSPAFTLAPSASQSFTTTHAISQADLDRGFIENIAKVAGQDPFNQTLEGADTLTVQALQGPALELEKTVSQTTFTTAGEVVTYTFVVTNTGNLTLTGVVLDDPRVSFNQAVGTLAPGASQTFTFDYTLTQTDVDGQVVINTATATGIAPDSSTVSVNDVAYVTIEDLGALDINKVALNKSYSSVGEQVDFEITVSNIGNVTIDNVRVIDALTGLDSNIGTLQPGANVVVPTSYVITQADIDAGKIVNLATVEGVENTPQARPVSAKDEATAFAIRKGAVKIEKVTSTPTYDVAGFTLRYDIKVTNTGNVTLSNVRVTDPLTKLDQTIPSLSPGQTVSIPNTYVATLADMNAGEITNLAFVSATTPGNLTVSDKDAVRNQAVQRPAVSLAKTANVSDYDQVGDLITYIIEASNTGNVTLFNLVISDPLTGTNQNIGNLDPGQSFSITEFYQITQADLDAGLVVNTAEVVGLDPNSSTISATASATVPAIQTATIEFTKTGTPNSYDQVGDIITYRLTVKNTGNVTLRNLVITDLLTGLNQTFASLAPQSSQVINETYAVTQADIDGGFILNTANVQALDPSNQKLASSASFVVNAQQNPGIALTKVTTTPTYSQVGDILSFTLEISNTGNETLTDVTVKDPLTNLDQNLGTISPGQSQTLVTTYTITQADLDAGQVTNTASVNGLDPNSQSLVASAASIANAIQSPDLSLTKTSQSNSYSQNGELITFDLRVENTGNVTLQNVLVKDPLTGLNQNVGTLSPGQSTSVSTTYRITQQDLDKGQFVNTGIVEGLDPLGNTIRVSESETITAQLNPEIEITKSAIPTTYDQVGDVIRYVLKIRNTGNVTMNSIRVTDPLTGLDRNLGILVPKKVLTLNESYTITQLDIDRGEVINTAFVSAKSPDKTDYQDSDTVTVIAVQNPGLGLTKTTATPFYSKVGDVLDFDLVVKNTGNETLFKVKLQDPLTGLVQSLGTMNPGDSIAVSTSYTVTQADVDAGQVDNSASVLGLDPNNKKVSASASSVAIASQAPSIDIKKTATPTTYDQVGDIITYQLEISNTGNLTLSDVVVVDPLTNTNQAIGTLTPGQKITLTEAYQIKQSDIDNGSVINTAAVSALDPNGLDVSDNASATATAVQNPGIGIIKSTVTPGNYSLPGDEVEFTIIVSNTGNETLSDVTVVDPLTNLNQVVGILLPGETQTITTSYFVSQADINAGKVINTAIVSGTDPNNQILSSSAVSLASAIQSSSISIVKTADKNDFNQLGEIITYSFDLTNTGNTTLSNIVLSDPLINLTESVQPLSPGASYTTSGTYTVKQSDLDQGFIRNVASLSAEDPTNSILRDADTLLINAVQNPDLTLIKTATTQTYSSVGEDITYELTVTNSGNVTLTDLNLVDPLTGLNQDLGDFIPGESISIQSNYVITQGDLDAGEVINTATVSGLDPSSQGVSDSDTVAINAVQNPDLLFEKIAIPRIYDQAGDQITYTLTVTNTGNLTLNSLQLSDPLTATDNSLGSLAPGQVKTLTVVYQTSQQDVDSGEVLNTATISGLDPFGNSITRIDTALVTAIQNPGIGLIKSVDKKEYSQVGEVLTYTLKVENTGNETLDNVTVVDPLTGLTQNMGSLSPGESLSVTTSYTVTQQDLDSGRVLNTGTASGTDPNQTVVSVDAQAVSNAVQTPGLGLSKEVSPTEYDQAGDVLTYQLTVENTGNVTLTDVTITDPLTGLSQTIGTLTPGQQATVNEQYTVTQQDVDAGQVVNTASVTGTSLSQQTANATANATATAIQNPGIGLIKVSDKKEYSQVGEVLTYTLTAVNTGNETLTDVTVTDPLTGLTQNVGSLSPGESQSVVTSYTVTQQDLDSGRVLNTGTASGTDPNQTVVSVDAQAVSNAVQTPGLGLSKEVLPTEYDQAGDVLTYQLTVENTGNVTLTDVTITDPLTGLSQTIGTLTPGQQATVNEQYTVTQQDVDNGQVVNTASVTGTSPSQQTVGATASATATAVQNPGIGLIKSVDKKEYSQVGEVLTYTLKVENTGNETLDNVTVVDPLTGLTQNMGSLSPGESQSVTTSYTVTQQDIDSGRVLNTGTASGTDPNQTAVSADAQTVSNAVQTPAISLSKTVTPGTYDQAGDVLTYQLTVENTGNVTLTDVTVVDPLTGLSQTIGTLTPGQKATVNEQYTVTQQDVDDGQVVNTASVTGTSLSQQTANATANATATAIQNPGIGLIKVSDKKEYSQVGEVLTYTLTAVNTGNETLTDVTVTDPLTGLTQNVGSLAPGESQSVVTSYTVTQQDLDSGRVLNTGTARGTDPNQTVVSADAQAVSFALANPQVELRKIAEETTFSKVGDVINYQLVIENTGNITIRDIVVEDPLTGLTEEIEQLDVNQTITLFTTYTITVEDVQRGFFTNTAFVSGSYFGSELIEANGFATSNFISFEIIANDDEFGVFPLSYAGSLGNALNNDLVSGSSPDPADIIIELIDAGGLVGVSFDDEGNLILIPGLNEPGIFRLIYRISQVGFETNQDEATITVELEEDRVEISVQKSTLATEIFEGDEFVYEILIQNLGETSAKGVVVRDELPSGVQRISEEIIRISDPQIVITPVVSGNVLTWEIPFLPSGSEVVIQIKVKAGDPGMVTNVVSIESEGVDIDMSNNQDSVTDEIRAFRITNVITPNSDGFNDEFEIKGLHKFTENRLVIFNRLGDSVLEVDDYQNNWSAEGLSPGTYFYVLKAKNSSNEEFVFQGWIQVIKR